MPYNIKKNRKYIIFFVLIQIYTTSHAQDGYELDALLRLADSFEVSYICDLEKVDFDLKNYDNQYNRSAYIIAEQVDDYLGYHVYRMTISTIFDSVDYISLLPGGHNFCISTKKGDGMFPTYSNPSNRHGVFYIFEYSLDVLFDAENERYIAVYNEGILIPEILQFNHLQWNDWVIKAEPDPDMTIPLMKYD